MDVHPSATRILENRVQRWYGHTKQIKGEEKMKDEDNKRKERRTHKINGRKRTKKRGGWQDLFNLNYLF
jgi:hypothetical protein